MKDGKLLRPGRTLHISILLVLVALVSMTAATIAWFTIADRTRVKSMNMDVSTGYALRMDMVAHDSFDQYLKTLGFETIADYVRDNQGYDMRTVPMEPVTTNDDVTFTYENGTVVQNNSGVYLEFVLHFMGSQDMIVHLTSANSSGGNQDGTSVGSSREGLPQAMRISFTTDGENVIYSPGMGSFSQESGFGRIFGLPNASSMVYNDDNKLFSLEKDVDKAVTVRIWLEGTDAACTNDLKGADYQISFRFEGTRSDNTKLTE